MCVIYGRVSGENPSDHGGVHSICREADRRDPERLQNFGGENGKATCRGVKERRWNEGVCVRVCKYMCLCMIDMIDKSAGVCEREGENEEGMNE